MFIFFKLKINNRGPQKIVKESKLKANKPIGFNNCNTSGNQDQLYAHKFHGKPVSILLLRKSTKDNEEQKIKIEVKLLAIKGPTTRVPNPKNKPKNKGIKVKAKGIKMKNFSSYVNEFAIQ